MIYVFTLFNLHIKRSGLHWDSHVLPNILIYAWGWRFISVPEVLLCATGESMSWNCHYSDYYVSPWPGIAPGLMPSEHVTHPSNWLLLLLSTCIYTCVYLCLYKLCQSLYKLCKRILSIGLDLWYTEHC